MDTCEDYSGRQYEEISFFNQAKFNIGGFTRLFTSICLLLIYFRSKRKAVFTGGGYTRALILPSYFQYIFAFMFSNVIFGITAFFYPRDRQQFFLLAIEIGIYRLFIEGLAFFLMQYGAGQFAMRNAFLLAVAWGIITGIVYYFVLVYSDHGRYDEAYTIYSIHTTLLVIYYASMNIVSVKILYRRPALKVYGFYQAIENTMWLLVTTLLYADIMFGYCMLLVSRVAFQGLLQPLLIYYALVEDSEFWQGIGNSSPLAGMWEIDAGTAEGISDGLSVLASSKKSLPLIHFGSISLHQQIGFVAGGMSRVYFGTWKQQDVALKILFAMELTPDVVTEFYAEVQTLSTLQHKNVVACLGISVMPPSIALVMEHCPFGSLFDYLYKSKNSKLEGADERSNGSRVASVIHEFRQRISSLGSTKTNSSKSKSQRASDLSGPSTSMTFIKSPMVTNRGSLYRRDSPDDEFNDLCLNDVEANPATSRVSLTGSRLSMNQRNSFGSSSAGDNRIDRDSIKCSFSRNRPRGMSMNQRMRGKLTTRNVANHSVLSGSSAKPQSAAAPFNTGSSSPSQHNQSPADQSLPSFTFLERLQMMHDVVSGILFLHQQGFIHCDIKSPNFLVANDRTIKVADLGEAREVFETSEPSELPNPAINWSPPEMLRPNFPDRKYSMHSDVFGVAMVLSEILLQVVPLDEANVKLSEATAYKKLVDENWRPSFPPTVPQPLVDVLNKAWHTDPSARATCEDILNVIEDVLHKQ